MVTRSKPVPVIKVPVRIRFVGGPWHNLIPLLERLEVRFYTADGEHCYHLAEFVSPGETVYYQYIHSSLISEGGVSARVCKEYFPRFSINVRQLELRLAGKLPPKRRLRW